MSGIPAPGWLRDRRFDVCVYHANCPDGFGAAWAVRAAKGDAVRYVAGHSHRPVSPADYRGLAVLLVDYCWERPTLEAVLAEARSITVIDHHLTARDAVGGLDLPGLETFFDMERSGASLAWVAFHAGEAPPLIRHVEDYDLFRFALPGTDEINLALTSRPFDFAEWDRLDTAALKAEGAAILRWVSAQVDCLAASAGRAALAGLDVPCANAPGCFVDRLGHRLAEGEPFAVVWAETADAVHFSLRSRPDGLAVNRVAEAFGGRGHRHAAVFALPKDSPEIARILRRRQP